MSATVPADAGGRAFERPLPNLIAQAREFDAATLHEAAGKIGALPSAIKPVGPQMRVCGSIVTVHSPPGDNLWIHRAICVAQPGDVLVVYPSGHYESGYWGDMMNSAAIARGLGGLVMDGCVRDGRAILAQGLPVFARGLCIRGTGKARGAPGWINAPLRIGDVVVHPGDLVLGDADGVVILPQAELAHILARAAERVADESDKRKRIGAGETTLELYGWK